MEYPPLPSGKYRYVVSVKPNRYGGEFWHIRRQRKRFWGWDDSGQPEGYGHSEARAIEMLSAQLTPATVVKVVQ